MRIPIAMRGFRSLARSAWRAQSRPRSSPRSLLLGGLGLSMLALSHGGVQAQVPSNLAQCETRYVSAHGDVELESEDRTFSFSLPLDAQRVGQIPASNHVRAARFSCASYKANFPIEDRFDVQVNDNGDVFALVLDGHGGWQVAEYARNVLVGNVRQEVEQLGKPTRSGNPQDEQEQDRAEVPPKQLALAIQRGFARTDRALMAKVIDAFQLGFGAVGRCGSCALLVLVQDNMLHIANAGDSRAVLGRRNDEKYEAIALSQDQNAMSLVEQERLKREHPGEDNVFVCRRPDSCYVKHALQPTRSLGDFALKYSEFNGPPYVHGDRSAGRHIGAPYTPPYISPVPVVKTHALGDDDAFVIIGSDGVWDFLSNEDAVEVVRHQIAIGHPDEAAQAVVEKTLRVAAEESGMSYEDLLRLPPGNNRRHRHDDTTVVVVLLHH